ncbi:MAG: ABC transporter ATP-binding protein [Candidatus Thermoplasmatota archaeon]|nr:ABC transporter ATP-binding protein [Candidatus Thermoplasmatota archaeon]
MLAGEIPKDYRPDDGIDILVRNVTKVYMTGKVPITAVNDLSLGIPKGKFLSLMGPSGCGKSTLLHLIGAVDRPTTGMIRVAGHSLSNMRDNELSDFRRDQIGFVFQFYNLIPSMTAYENIEIPLSFRGASKDERRKRVGEILKSVGLEDRADHTPSLLSGGEQQRVAIARAIVNDPDIILLDEPTGDLDRKSGEAIMELLLQIKKEKKKTYLMVTHDQKVASYSEDTLQMEDGRIRWGKR